MNDFSSTAFLPSRDSNLYCLLELLLFLICHDLRYILQDYSVCLNYSSFLDLVISYAKVIVYFLSSHLYSPIAYGVE